MNLFNTPDMPSLLKGLLWFSAAVGAVGVIWTQLHLRKLLAQVLNELSRNGGDTVKDLVTRAARDAKQAADDSKTALTQNEKLDRRMRRAARKIKTATEKQAQFELQMLEMDKKFTRLVVHEANNDLHASNLAKEARKRLEEFKDQ
jgi:Fe2+ transport system protein B